MSDTGYQKLDALPGFEDNEPKCLREIEERMGKGLVNSSFLPIFPAMGRKWFLRLH